MPASEKMFRYAKSILKEHELAEDVVQECLVKIWDKREKLASIQNPEAWAMRITRNQCYDWVKTNRFTVLTENDLNTPNTDSADLETLMDDHMNWLEKILASLPEKQREIYHLREVEEMPYQDIAEVLSLNLNEVKVNLHRARTKIRTSIDKLESYGIAN